MEYAAVLAKHHDAALYAGHVHIPTPPIYLEGAALVKYLDQAGEEKREQLTKLVEPFHVGESNVLVGEGIIEYAIQRWTVEHGIDLIVIGTLPRISPSRRSMRFRMRFPWRTNAALTSHSCTCSERTLTFPTAAE
jgi:nucleotide-binding universal stress UspA family protein